jgi:hypothetical protein
MELIRHAQVRIRNLGANGQKGQFESDLYRPNFAKRLRPPNQPTSRDKRSGNTATAK